MTEQRVSLRALARELGVTETAVRKGVKSERLKVTVGYDEKRRPFIRDLRAGVIEWTRGATVQSITQAAAREARKAHQRASPHRGLQPGRATSLRPNGTGTPVDVLIEHTPLEQVSVCLLTCPGGDRVLISTERAAGTDDWLPVLSVDKLTAATLGLRLWIEAAGHVEDLPAA